ncbi:hypothetical protein BgiBS90_029235, partial [Biomphalaria glabrata]
RHRRRSMEGYGCKCDMENEVGIGRGGGGGTGDGGQGRHGRWGSQFTCKLESVKLACRPDAAINCNRYPAVALH